MNNRALPLSFLMAGAAMFFVYSYVSEVEEKAGEKFGTEVNVLVATKDIKEMETLDEKMFTLKAIPKKFREPAAIQFDTPVDEAGETSGKINSDIKELSGSVALVPIKQGEQITYNKVTEPNIRIGLSPQVAPGRRAVSVPVNEITGVAKLVKPGDRVDLIAVLDSGSGRQNKIAKTILQDVVILSVGRNVTNNIPRLLDDRSGKTRVSSLTRNSSFTSVTLEVEPSQAQVLALILGGGNSQISLSLRNNDDTDSVNLNGTTIWDILGNDRVKVNRNPAGRQ